MVDVNKLKIYALSKEIVSDIYLLTRSFPAQEMYGITSQIRRSAISVGANIVEGAGRETQKDFHRFLFISIGSLNETKYYLEISQENNFINQNDFIKVYNKIELLRKMLLSFIKNSRSPPLLHPAPPPLNNTI